MKKTRVLFKPFILFILCSFAVQPLAYADLPPPESIPYTYVSIDDPDVINVANFATDQIKRGSLYKIISAQKQSATDITFFLVLDLVDAHVRHHHYSVQVLIPNDGSDWKILYFTAVNY